MMPTYQDLEPIKCNNAGKIKALYLLKNGFEDEFANADEAALLQMELDGKIIKCDGGKTEKPLHVHNVVIRKPGSGADVLEKK